MDFKKRLAILLIISLAVIAVLTTAIIFMGLDIKSRAQEVSRLRADFNFRARAIESIAELRSDYEKSKPYAGEIKNILPTQDQLVNFSRDMNLIANQNKINLSLSLKGGGQLKTETPALQKNDFSATAQGTLNSLINFLRAVKTSRYFIQMNSLDISKQGENTFSILINGQVFAL